MRRGRFEAIGAAMTEAEKEEKEPESKQEVQEEKQVWFS